MALHLQETLNWPLFLKYRNDHAATNQRDRAIIQLPLIKQLYNLLNCKNKTLIIHTEIFPKHDPVDYFKIKHADND